MNTQSIALVAFNPKGQEMEHEIFETKKAAKQTLKDWLDANFWNRRGEDPEWHLHIHTIDLMIDDELEDSITTPWNLP